MRAYQLEQRVQRRLYRRADGPTLDVGVHTLVGYAKFSREFCGFGRASVGDEEIAFARKNVVDAGESMRDHGRRGDAMVRRHAAKVEGLLDMVFIAHPARDTRSLLRREREQVPRLALVHAAHCAGCGSRSKHRAETVRRVPVRQKLIRRQRHRQPATDVVAQRDCTQQRHAVAPLALADRQRRRHDAAARMRQRRRVRVIGLVGVRQHAIGERGICRRSDDAAADDARLAGAAQGFHVRNRASAGQQS